MSESPRPRRSTAPFRPRFTLMLFYLVLFFVLFAFLFMFPDLLQAARELPPGPEELSEAERARAAEIGRQALRPNFMFALLAAVAATGVGLWRRVLPGLR